jgi:hypothetical protein
MTAKGRGHSPGLFAGGRLAAVSLDCDHARSPHKCFMMLAFATAARWEDRPGAET